jgi:hypothetical protein
MQALTSVDAVMAFYRKQLVALEQRNYSACKSSGAWKLCGMMRQESQYFGKVY